MTDETATQEQTERTMILTAAKSYDLEPDDWVTDEEDDGRVTAKFGRWFAFEDMEELGVSEGEEGELYATVVGAARHRNQRVAWYFTVDDMDVGVEVEPGEQVERCG